MKKQKQIGRCVITLNHDSPRGWDRFGGGWNWKLGFQIGGKTLIVNLLVCYVRFDWIDR